MLNTSQQVGGSLGTALLNTLFAGAVTAYLADNVTSPRRRQQTVARDAFIHGYHVAFFWGAVLLAAALVVAACADQRPQAPHGVTDHHAGRLLAHGRRLSTARW